MYNNKKLIGQKIKEFRKKKNMSQYQLAEIVGLSDKHIGRIEAGKYVPNCINFLNILSVLSLDLAEIGFNIERTSNKERDSLIELIYSSSEEEIKLYMAVCKALKEEFEK